MHEGEWSSRLGIAGPARRGRGADGDARHRARAAHRRAACTSSTCRRRARSRWCGPRARTACPSPPRRPPTTSRLTHAACASFDPVFKVNPPLRTDADVAAVRGGLADGSLDAIATDHAPHAQEAKEQPFDQAPPGMLGLETALALALTELDLPIEIGARACSRGSRPRSPGSPARTGGRSRPATPPTSASSTRPPSGWSIRRAREPQPQHAVRRPQAEGPRAPHAARGRGGRDRRRGAAMSADPRPEALLVLATARSSRARRSARRAGGGERRGRLQHRAVRLPGGHHRPVLRRPDHQLHLSAHRQLRRDRARRGEPPAVLPRRRRPGLQRPAEQLAVDESLDDFLVRTGVAGISGVDTRRLTRHIREAGAMPGAFGTASEAELLAAAKAEPGTDGVDLVATVTCDEPYTIGDGPFRVVAYDFGIKATMLRQLGELATVEVVPASTTASEVLAREPDGVFLSNGPGDPAALGYAVADDRRAARRGAGVRHLPRPPAARRGARRAHLQAPLRTPRRQPPGAPPRDRTGRDHEPEPQLRRRRRRRSTAPTSPT